MATANFEKQEGFKLYVLDTSEFFQEDYEYLVYEFSLAKQKHFEEALDTERLYVNNEVDIILEDGYYTGVQLYVNVYTDLGKHTLEAVEESLKNIADELGMTEIRVIGRFSNGETLYEEVTKG